MYLQNVRLRRTVSVSQSRGKKKNKKQHSKQLQHRNLIMCQRESAGPYLTAKAKVVRSVPRVPSLHFIYLSQAQTNSSSAVYRPIFAYIC